MVYETKTFPTGKNEKEVESNIFGVLENEEFVKNNSYLNSKIFEWVKHTLNKIKHLHVLMYVIVKNITYMKKNKLSSWGMEQSVWMGYWVYYKIYWRDIK